MRTLLNLNYNWGVDGYGRAHLCKEGDNLIIFSMIDGSGLLGAMILQEQDQQNEHKRSKNGTPENTKAVSRVAHW